MSRLTIGSMFVCVLAVAGTLSAQEQRGALRVERADVLGRTRISAAIDQQNLTQDPRFLQFDGFQEPIKARLTLRFTF